MNTDIHSFSNLVPNFSRTRFSTREIYDREILNFFVISRNHTGLSDNAVNLLSELKEDSPAQLRVINFLLEQAAGDMDILPMTLMIAIIRAVF